MPHFSYPIPSIFSTPAPPQPSAIDLWHQGAGADYHLCRIFADRFDARLPRSPRSRRAGWEREGRSVYGILLPDPMPSAHLTEDDWYIYYVWGKTMFRRTRKERDRLRMIVLPDNAEDWGELLRQAVHDEVFDVQWTLSPQYVNALGEIEAASSGYQFTLSGCAPPAAAPSAFQISGIGETPETAAREAARRWLNKSLQEQSCPSLTAS